MQKQARVQGQRASHVSGATSTTIMDSPPAGAWEGKGENGVTCVLACEVRGETAVARARAGSLMEAACSVTD